MAKQILPTDYVNDVLSSSMNGRRKYNMINNSDGTVSFEDVTTYEQTGSNFGASDLNAICKAVNDSADAEALENGTITVNSNKFLNLQNGLFISEHEFNITPTNAGENNTQETTLTQSGGYYPLGIVGYSLSGTMSSSVLMYGLRIVTRSSGSAKILAKYKNIHETDPTVMQTLLMVHILWAKTG